MDEQAVMDKRALEIKMAKARAVKEEKKQQGKVSYEVRKPPVVSKPKLVTLAGSPNKVETKSPEKTTETTSEPEETTFLGIPLKEKTEEEKRLIRFKEFLNTHWGLPAVTVQFRGLFAGGYPPIPIPTRWQLPQGIDIEDLVWRQVQTEKFIDEIWPSVVMMLGDDIPNFEWAAQVATVLALFNLIRVLPIAIEDTE